MKVVHVDMPWSSSIHVEWVIGTVLLVPMSVDSDVDSTGGPS